MVKKTDNAAPQSCCPEVTDVVQNSYPWILLPNPPHKLVYALQKTVYDFVWNIKQDK